MKILVIGDAHFKNKMGLTYILDYLNWEYKFGGIQDIVHYDYIYSPGKAINMSNYPDKKFIFGPHFSVFPDQKLSILNNKCKNAIYIQPSKWVVELWRNMKAEIVLPIKSFPFPVNTNKFKPIEGINKTEVFLYYKRRNPEELNFIINYLKDKNINFKKFDYMQRYNEEDYLNTLQNSKYGIVLDAHESQGFAIEEALSCNVPLLVWNTTTMAQEYGFNYENIPCTTIPYWDNKCGEFFYNQEEFIATFDLFLNKLNTYNPRQYILDTLSTEVCANRWKELFNNL